MSIGEQEHYTTVTKKELARLRFIEAQAQRLAPFCYTLSYNSSYFGEPPGLLKQVVMEINRNVPLLPTEQAVKNNDLEENIEKAFWEFDARHKGIGPHQGRPQNERDAFKWTVRGLLANGQNSS